MTESTVSPHIPGKRSRWAWVISVLMGLGHVRAAYPLRDIARGGIFLYGSRAVTPRREHRLWRKIRSSYYVISRAGSIPILGKYILAPMLALQKIKPYYPVQDMTRPNLAVYYLDYLISKKRLCAALFQRVSNTSLPVIHTFYATAIALEKLGRKVGVPHLKNYLLICDTDFNRVWVPRNPAESDICYLAPCTQVRNRLLTYGVPERNIYLTGFPLPKENIGSAENLEILKLDLFQRLVRLDPAGKFFSFHQKSVYHWLNRCVRPSQTAGRFTLTFAVGGSGAQTEIVGKILRSLKAKIVQGKINIVFSAGIQKQVFEKVLGFVNSLSLTEYLDQRIKVIYDHDVYRYIDRFNEALRGTDVLWTKPSELSFYCALGIPILLAPPIGTHEEMNQRWLHELHAGIDPPGSVEYTHEWLFDLRENGRLAEAAWDGFLKARKLGTFKIEDLVLSGSFSPSQHPLEQ